MNEEKPACDALVINMEAESHDPVARQSMQADVIRLVALGREQTDVAPIVVIHGNSTCVPQRYSAMGYVKALERCWHESWAGLVNSSTLMDSACIEEGTRRWCVGRLNLSSTCTRRPPLLVVTDNYMEPRPRRARRKRCNVRMAASFAVFTDGHMRWSLRTEARYFSLLPCDAPDGGSASSRILIGENTTALCLLFKNNQHEAWVGGLVSTDGGQLFRGEPQLVMPAYNPKAGGRVAKAWGLPRSATLTHNFAALRLPNGSFALVGGRHREPTRLYDGIWMAIGTSTWQWNSHERTSLAPVYVGRGNYMPLNISAPMQWTNLRRVLNGSHPGCVEARDHATFPQLAGPGVCEFDGRLSLAHLGGRFLLYARANRAAQGGQRSVQVSHSADLISPHLPFHDLR